MKIATRAMKVVLASGIVLAIPFLTARKIFNACKKVQMGAQSLYYREVIGNIETPAQKALEDTKKLRTAWKPSQEQPTKSRILNCAISYDPPWWLQDPKQSRHSVGVCVFGEAASDPEVVAAAKALNLREAKLEPFDAITIHNRCRRGLLRSLTIRTLYVKYHFVFNNDLAHCGNAFPPLGTIQENDDLVFYLPAPTALSQFQLTQTPQPEYNSKANNFIKMYLTPKPQQ